MRIKDCRYRVVYSRSEELLRFTNLTTVLRPTLQPPSLPIVLLSFPRLLSCLRLNFFLLFSFSLLSFSKKIASLPTIIYFPLFPFDAQLFFIPISR